jgi:DNA-binding transcriptional regulator LsrR (DeoR family)
MSRHATPVDVRLLIKVSKLYFEQHLTQQEISDHLYLSRPKVSRLLRQAQDRGIVKITIVTPQGSYTDLEQQLEDRFRLDEAVVVEVERNAPQAVIARELGTAAAQHLQRTLEPNDVVGVSWGLTLNAMVNALQPSNAPEVHLVQLLGGLGAPEAEEHATDIARRLARLLGCKLTLIPAPGIVDSSEAQAALMADRHVERAFKLFPAITLAFVGIGVPSPLSVVMRDGSILSQTQLNHLLAAGAVGDICLRFFDSAGQPIISTLDNRVIGITLGQLRRVGRVVGIAGGLEKFRAVYGALHGGLVNVLITDSALAAELIERDFIEAGGK